MNQFSKFFALLGLSASVALVGTGCAAEVEDPESELALADEADDSAELAVSADEATAESEDALSSNGCGIGYIGGGCGAGYVGGFVGGYGGGCGYGRGYDCLIGGRHFHRGPYYGPYGGYGRGYYGYGHRGWAGAHGRVGAGW